MTRWCLMTSCVGCVLLNRTVRGKTATSALNLFFSSKGVIWVLAEFSLLQLIHTEIVICTQKPCQYHICRMNNIF